MPVARAPRQGPTKITRLANTFHAEHIVRAMRFARRLRNAEDSQPVLLDASDYLSYVTGLDTETIADLNNPSAGAVRRGYLRMDSLRMNLERREWLQWLQWLQWHSVKAINICVYIYADGSPVSGSQVQGMCYDVIFVWRVAMPSMGMSYGLSGAMNKLAAFIWSRFLLTGPCPDVMHYPSRKVCSVTTEIGTDIKFVALSSIVDAFCPWVRGTNLANLRETIDPA